MSHPLDGARLKVVRAQEQLASFKDEVSRYLDAKPYEFPVEDHGNAVTARAAVIKEEPPLRLGRALRLTMRSRRLAIMPGTPVRRACARSFGVKAGKRTIETASKPS